MSMLRIIRVAAVASTAALLTAVILFSLLRPLARPQAENVPIGGPFELVDRDRTYVTDRTFAGKASVVFFGYTSCPDACPTTLSDLSAWLKAIGRDADKLNVLFISIDPEPDTPAHLKE
jgi:protein SCO1